MSPDSAAGSGRSRLGATSGLAIAAAAACGVLCGLGAFTFGYGDGAAYLRDDPAACANCHVMKEQYDSWINSSHHAVATCNDCHLRPHAVGKWVTKADNGFFHSLAFTTGRFPDPIEIKPRNRRVAQAACLSCHADFVHAALAPGDEAGVARCARCHRDVGHALR
jgi:cytochrome c nitrite reductase small subunit